jgi:hypothetical protein
MLELIGAGWHGVSIRVFFPLQPDYWSKAHFILVNFHLDSTAEGQKIPPLAATYEQGARPRDFRLVTRNG